MRTLRPYVLTLATFATLSLHAEGFNGYYRDPAVHGDTLVFVAEGDLWKVPLAGGIAQRLTTHPGEESAPVISPDGSTLAFTARYEGPAEVYTMPLAGGLPVRRTFEGDSSVATTAFRPNGDLVYATQHYSTLPDLQLVGLDLATNERERIPLSQASEVSFDRSGKTLYFVRPGFHANVTRWYTGGTARQVWKFQDGAAEAEKLTRDHKGESHTPMWWQGRVFFITDRDRTMNVWSMNESGGDLEQHTDHRDWDVRHASLSEGRIVYSVGADVWVYDITANSKRKVPITLASDLDQLREKWVTKPMDNITSAHLHPKGDAVVITARGRVFVAPAKSGRLVQASRKQGVRYRDVVFMADGKSLLGLSDASGELEFVQLPPNGVGADRALTSDGKVLRFRGVPSPDGTSIAYNDNNNDAWVLNVRTQAHAKISTNREGTTDLAWSPDGRYLAFGQYATNSFMQLHIYDVQTRTLTPLTSDRVNSFDPAWSPDGNWIYFLSDRNLTSVVGAPWGPRQPEPYFAKPDKIYQVALRKGLRSPFKPADELAPGVDEKTTETTEEPTPAQPETPAPSLEPQEPEQLPPPDEQQQPQPPQPASNTRSASATAKAKQSEDADAKPDSKKGAVAKAVRIDVDGLSHRIYEVPAPPGDYNALSANPKALYWLARDSADDDKATLMVLEITNDEPKPAKFADDLRTYELSADGKKLLMRKDSDLFVVDAGTKSPSELPKSKVDLSAWSYSIDVREDWRQIYLDAWRLERDYFYDPSMHGVGWERVRDKYLPLVDRVTTRAELSDVIGLAVGELSALHTAVREGDMRRGQDNVRVPTLGARLMLDKRADGYRIDYIYQADPDYPHERSPLSDPALNISAGDVITMINGVDVLSVGQPNALLRNQAKQQVLLRLKPKSGRTTRDVIVTPMDNEFDLRYTDWEYTRRLRADQLSNNTIGYVHLRAMNGVDLTSWFRNFYPVFNRQGLIIDARHNRGGNIDSFILARLLRKEWMYWKNRVGEPYANMQYAFRGHAVVLVDENTASDGEAFAEGFRRLGLGKVIGVRTWGGEIWLDSQNRLTDGGFARAPMSGVYGPEGKWLIEQHGVDPDIVVENLPHATFNGGDAQLEVAVKELLQQIEKDPRPLPQPPAYPHIDKE
jgi:tricorn protease